MQSANGLLYVRQKPIYVYKNNIADKSVPAVQYCKPLTQPHIQHQFLSDMPLVGRVPAARLCRALVGCARMLVFCTRMLVFCTRTRTIVCCTRTLVCCTRALSCFTCTLVCCTRTRAFLHCLAVSCTRDRGTLIVNVGLTLWFSVYPCFS